MKGGLPLDVVIRESAIFHIAQDIGELKIVLRFAVDACTSSANDADDENGFLEALSGLEISGTSASTKSGPNKSRAHAVRGVSIARTTPRKLVPQASLVGIKTCAGHCKMDWAKVYPQLYLSQTAFLYIAKHHRGTFDSPEKVELGAKSMLACFFPSHPPSSGVPHLRHAP